MIHFRLAKLKQTSTKAITKAALLLAIVAVVALPQIASATVAAPLIYNSTIGGPGHAAVYPGGVEVDPNGIAYVSDTGNDRVEAYNLDGSLKWVVGNRGSKTLGNFDTPRDIAYSNGKLYVADLGNKRIQVLDATTGTPQLIWSAVLPSPIGISAGVDASGNPVILVSQDTSNLVSEYKTDGSFIQNIGNSQLKAPRDADTDSAGNIYVADYANDRVVKFTPAGALIKTWGSSGGGNSQFRRPYGVTLDVQNRVYVADSTNHRVQIFDSNGNFLSKFGTAGSAAGQYTMLRRVGVRPGVVNPDIYMADLWGFKLERVSQDSSFNFIVDNTYGNVPPVDGMFNEPSGVVVTPNYVYVADAVNQRMQRFDAATGAYQLQWGERGWGTDLEGLNWPRDLTYNSSSNTMWVADTKNGRLVEFDPSGNPTGRTFGSQGPAIGQFNRIYAVISYGSSLILADSFNNRVQRWDMSTPSPTLVWNKTGLSNPKAVVVDGSTVLATDTRNNQLFRLDINTGAQIGSPLGVGSLHSPEGVAVDANHHIWVANRTSGRLAELASDGTLIQGFGKPGSAHGQFNSPTHLTVFGNKLYVCDTWNDRVEVYTITP